MHSLADYTYADIRAAVLSFIQTHDTGTYALDNHLLTYQQQAEHCFVRYQLGCHTWTFTYALPEVGR